jgi:hypothetical protein
VANEHTVVYTAVYDDKSAALADLDTVKQLHKDGVIGKYDAAVIDKENGKGRIVKRVDDPDYSVVQEFFGETMPTGSELNEAAGELLEGDAGLVVVAETTADAKIEQELDKELTGAIKTAKHDFDTSADKLVEAINR